MILDHFTKQIAMKFDPSADFLQSRIILSPQFCFETQPLIISTVNSLLFFGDILNSGLKH
jgi:hypothetical protein